MRSKSAPLRAATITAAAALLVACGSMTSPMTFFVTSTGSGKGGDLGGLMGADQLCARLANAAGAPAHEWRAYLSTVAVTGYPAVNARDRIGPGPWVNAAGVEIAASVEALHADNAAGLTKETALSETGEVIAGRGDSPNRHDILTGSLPDGTASPDTCGDWTLGGAEGAAMVGHHDRMGLDDSAPAKSWNSSHPSRGGCSLEALRGTGGDGLFYCFAAD